MSNTIAETNHTLRFILETESDSDLPIYLASNFNGWNARDENYRLKKERGGKYKITLFSKNELPGIIEYKYTRGDWNSVEVDEQGNGIPNRTIKRERKLVRDQVKRWAGQEYKINSALLPQPKIISEQFEMPQLIKTRRVAALLPHDYFQTNKRYPVLYLQDGQNLFDDYAPFGNWGVDKKLAYMAERGYGDLIVVAIDHAEEERIKEFTPSFVNRFGGGNGKKYVRFLTETLKPYVDNNFRTKPERRHTGIGGSSMGGLISIYAGLMYPNIYSKLLIFSPSLWLAPNIHFHSLKLNESLDTKIYLYAGGSESKNMVPNIKRFKSELERQGTGAQLDFELNIDPYGQHNEARWGEEFPRAVKWLFFNT